MSLSADVCGMRISIDNTLFGRHVTGADLDWHTRGVISYGEQNPLAAHPLEARSELDLANGKGVTQVETAVHVRVREGTEPFGMFLLNRLHRLLGLEKSCIGLHPLRQRRCIGFEMMSVLPSALDRLLNIDEIVALVSLGDRSQCPFQYSAPVCELTFSITTTEPAPALGSTVAAMLRADRVL